MKLYMLECPKMGLFNGFTYLNGRFSPIWRAVEGSATIGFPSTLIFTNYEAMKEAMDELQVMGFEIHVHRFVKESIK